jgi:hypothetical protein
MLYCILNRNSEHIPRSLLQGNLQLSGFIFSLSISVAIDRIDEFSEPSEIKSVEIHNKPR